AGVRRGCDERREPGNAVFGPDAVEPDERHASRVDVAVWREGADTDDGIARLRLRATIDARENQELGGRLESDARFALTHRDAASALETAPAAARAAVAEVVGAAHLTRPRYERRAIADPRGDTARRDRLNFA